MSAEQYYLKPVPIGGSSATATPTGTLVPGTATPTPTATVGQATYTSRAVASPASAARGATVAIASSITSAQASNVLIDVEVWDQSGTRVFQQFWDNQAFTAGQTRTFSSTWQVPSGALVGPYSIAVGVFSPGWGTLYSWNNAAGSLSVTATAAATSTVMATSTRTPTPTKTAMPTNTPVVVATATRTSTPGAATYSSSASVSPASVARGKSVSITASVWSSANSNALVDLEIYDAAGTKVFQQAWDNTTFSAKVPRTFTTSYAVATTAGTGSYTVKIGIFGPGWSSFIAWNDQAAVFSVT
jgi:hypothetical protein